MNRATSIDIHISTCCAPPHPVYDALRDRWLEVVKSGKRARLFVWEARPGETHEQLLTRMLARIQGELQGSAGPPPPTPGDAGARPGRACAISELDFIPSNTFVDMCLSGPSVQLAPWGQHRLDGSYEEYFPMTAPWLMVFEDPAALPADLFISLGKPFDVACPTLYRLLRLGLARPGDVEVRPGSQPYPGEFLGVRYPGYGVHCFYARNYALPEERQLGRVPGYTLRQHLAGIDRALTEAGAGSP